MSSTSSVPKTLRDGCQVCGALVVRKGKHGPYPDYCSPKCKQAAYRLRHGQDNAYYAQRLAVAPTCGRAGCENEAELGRRGYRMYCSDACKQKAKRQRLLAATRRQFGPTIKSVPETLPVLPADDLLYWRKGRGVVHMGVQRNVTFCGRDTEGMTEVGNGEGHKVCQRCQKTRDESTWWHGWREAFRTG